VVPAVDDLDGGRSHRHVVASIQLELDAGLRGGRSASRRRERTTDPVVREGLCEAEIIAAATPSAAESHATAGVGRHLPPTLCPHPVPSQTLGKRAARGRGPIHVGIATDEERVPPSTDAATSPKRPIEIDGQFVVRTDRATHRCRIAESLAPKRPDHRLE
jgi:hypothetical protein